MEIKLVNEKGEILYEPHTIRLHNWTEERYFKEAPRDRKCEFVKGDLIIMTPMSEDHSDVATFLSFLLRGYCDTKDLGKLLTGPTIRLESGINREPDLCFFPKKKAHLVKGMPIEEIPSFIIEVSHTTRSMDLGEKAFDYERAGVGEYWVVDMEEEELVIHHLENGKYQKETLTKGRLESREIEGFYIEVDWLWERPLPGSFECLKGILGI